MCRCATPTSATSMCTTATIPASTTGACRSAWPDAPSRMPKEPNAGGNTTTARSRSRAWVARIRRSCRPRRWRADAIFPQVTFVPGLAATSWFSASIVYREFGQGMQAQQSGIYIAHSEDGIHWSKPTQLIHIHSSPGGAWHGDRMASGVASFGSGRRHCQGMALLLLQRAVGAQAAAEAPLSRRPAYHVLDCWKVVINGRVELALLQQCKSA